MGSAADRWERFARDDPLFFIETDPRLRGDLDDFLTSGRALADWALELAGDGLAHGRALEIGCGMGRNVIGLARHFQRVDGIDVAATMLERAEGIGVPGNVHLALTPGDGTLDFGDGELDLVFSHLVLQHVPEEAVVARYLAETARVLRPSGRALLQFDTRPGSPAERVVHALPDPLLPRRLRRHVRRVRRSPERIDELVARAGLAPGPELGRGTAEHWLLLERQPLSRA
jgi:SAM-dependent methyltransferase